jgi:hypothetical protein
MSSWRVELALHDPLCVEIAQEDPVLRTVPTWPGELAVPSLPGMNRRSPGCSSTLSDFGIRDAATVLHSV